MFSGRPTLAVQRKKPRKEPGRQPAAVPRRAAAARSGRDAFGWEFIVAPLVFGSGCAALVFQVAWIRELRLIFGATTASVAAVLAIFMAGLGIGSAVLGKRADRVRNPLYLYGALEVAIAISAAASPWLIDLASSIYIGLGGQESLGLTSATVVRIGLSTAVMIVPTFLMGGTLPAAVRAVTRTTDQHRRALGLLYGANTLGAVMGTLLTTFIALQNLGTRATLWAGCALGLVAGSIAMVLSRRLPTFDAAVGVVLPAGPDRDVVTAPDSADAESRFRTGLIYMTAAVLGFTFFALELVWYRMLGPILGGTAYTFGLILCVVLLGIGVGGILYNVIFRWIRPTWSALAITCGCEALLTMVPFALGDRLALLAAWQFVAASNFTQLVLGWTYVTAIVVLPVSLVAGIQFPLLNALLGEGRRDVSRQLGMTYAWNTLGAIAGSLVGGFGGLPLLTAPGMWQACGLALAILAVCILAVAPGRGGRAAIAVGVLVAATIGATFTIGPTAAWRHSGVGAGRTYVPPYTQPNRLQQWLNDKRQAIIWEADGIESTVGIDGQNSWAFIVNGKSDGNALSDAATQTGVSVLGAVLHKDPKVALVIGLGTGESAGWLAQMRNIERVDVVELEPAIDEMASRCRSLNWDVLNNPKVRRIYNDGREHVFTTTEKYDLIISEPSNPYRAGIAALYTTEFYRAVRRRLNPGGLFVQWLQAYEIDQPTVATVVATVASEFVHVEIWQTLAADLQLVCSDVPIENSADELRERIGSGAIKDALEKTWSVYDLEGFLAHFAASAAWSRDVATQSFVPRNTDDCTVLEYSFAKTVGRQTPFVIEDVRDRLKPTNGHRPNVTGGNVDWNLVELRRQQFNVLMDGQLTLAYVTSEDDQNLVKAYAAYYNRDYATALKLWPAKYRQSSDRIQRLFLANCYAQLGRPECLEMLPTLEAQHPTEAAAIRAHYHGTRKEWAETAQALEQFYARLTESPWTTPTIVESAFGRTIDAVRADPAAARRIYERLSKRFAGRCYDYVRQIARVIVADQLGPDEVVAALSEMEPNVTWTAEILEPRAKAYAAVGHPLAARAQRDWEWFQRHEPPTQTRK